MFLVFLLFSILFTTSQAHECGVHPNETLRVGLHEPSNFATDNTRLIGGVETEPHTWPWMAQVMYHGQHRCGGTLIENGFILTAAHCFSRRGKNPKDYTVMLGGHDSGSGTSYKVTNISIHSLYNVAVPNAYDIALMKIDNFVNKTENVHDICLPLLPVQDNKICVVAGWGIESERAGKESEQLREIHIPTVSWFECAWKEQFRGRVHFPSMICAGDQNSLDSCQGDSGGPLMCYSNGKWEVQGLVSWGYGCGRPGLPGVYASVHSALPWIYAQMWILNNF